MGKELLNLEHEIEIGLENAKKAEKLYQLLSSYNAYSILLLKAKKEYEKQEYINQYNSDCYKEQIKDLFEIFKSDEYLKGKQLLRMNHNDMLFLIDEDTLLRMNSFDIMNSNIGGLSRINYELLKINNCVGKVYNKRVYCGDPYYCDTHCEEKDAFGLFYNGKLVTPIYALNNQLRLYDNMDIREILKIQTLDEIYDKITDAKNRKVKKLILS